MTTVEDMIHGMSGKGLAKLISTIADETFLEHWYCSKGCPNSAKKNKDEVCDTTCLSISSDDILEMLLKQPASVLDTEVKHESRTKGIPQK